MIKKRIPAMIIAAVLSVYANTAVLSAAAYAAEAEEPVSTQDVSIDNSVLQNTAVSGEDERDEEASLPETDEKEPDEKELNEKDLTEKKDVEKEAEKTAEQQSETAEQPTESEEQPETAEQPSESEEQPETVGLFAAGTASPDSSEEEHHLAFASDYHKTEGSIENALSGMPEDVEYVSLIGDMVGDRGGSHPDYESREILDLVREVFPALDNTSVSIVWATHDMSVHDEGTGIVKCMDGVSEPIREGTNRDGSPAYYIYGIGHYDMTKGNETSAGAAAAFKTWVNGINHTIPVIVLCHVPIQASRGDNNGASYWNEALNYASTGVEGITTTDTTADIIRNVLFLHGHNHTNDPLEYYFGAGTTLSVQVDKSSDQNDEPPRPPYGRKAEGVLSNIYYTSLTAGYLKTGGNAALVTVADGALSLAKYSGGENVSLGVNGTTKDLLGDSITIEAKRHIGGQADRENVTLSACESSGAYDLVVHCSVCGDILSRTHVVTKANGHSFGEWREVRKATEKAEGEEKRTCSVCGKTESRLISMLVPVKPEKAYSSDKNVNANVSEQRTEGAGQATAASPQTGDHSSPILWMAIMYMSLICLLTTSARIKRSGSLCEP